MHKHPMVKAKTIYLSAIRISFWLPCVLRLKNLLSILSLSLKLVALIVYVTRWYQSSSKKTWKEKTSKAHKCSM